MPDPIKMPKVYFARPNGELKELMPCHQAELEALLRIGWTTEKPKEGK